MPFLFVAKKLRHELYDEIMTLLFDKLKVPIEKQKLNKENGLRYSG